MTFSGLNLKGLILAAGLSSRMDSFKPFLTLNGRPIIDMTIDSLRNCGIDDIVVVVGHNANEMREYLKDRVRCVYNPEYANGEMFGSVKIGLSNLLGEDGVILLPADMPLISPGTIGKLVMSAPYVSEQVILPVYEGHRAHPPVILESAFAPILSHDGTGGLEGALRKLKVRGIPVHDPATRMDADTPEQYEELAAYARANTGISRDKCQVIWDRLGVPDNIRRHCIAVAEKGVELAEKAIKKGIWLDISLIESACLLHDIQRTRQEHAWIAAEILRRAGYTAIGNVIETHMSLARQTQLVIDEKAIVFLADKLVQEDVSVTITQRYSSSLENSAQDPAMTERIFSDIKAARRIYEEVTGSKGE